MITAGGNRVDITQIGTVMVGGRECEGYIVQESPMSLMSIDKMCDAGYTYCQSRQTAYLQRGDEVIQLTKRGGLWVEGTGQEEDDDLEQALYTFIRDCPIETALAMTYTATLHERQGHPYEGTAMKSGLSTSLKSFFIISP